MSRAGAQEPVLLQLPRFSSMYCRYKTRYVFVVGGLGSIFLLFGGKHGQMPASASGDFIRFWLLRPRLRAIAGMNAFFATIA